MPGEQIISKLKDKLTELNKILNKKKKKQVCKKDEKLTINKLTCEAIEMVNNQTNDEPNLEQFEKDLDILKKKYINVLIKDSMPVTDNTNYLRNKISTYIKKKIEVYKLCLDLIKISAHREQFMIDKQTETKKSKLSEYKEVCTDITKNAEYDLDCSPRSVGIFRSSKLTQPEIDKIIKYQNTAFTELLKQIKDQNDLLQDLTFKYGSINEETGDFEITDYTIIINFLSSDTNNHIEVSFSDNSGNKNPVEVPPDGVLFNSEDSPTTSETENNPKNRENLINFFNTTREEGEGIETRKGRESSAGEGAGEAGAAPHGQLGEYLFGDQGGQEAARAEINEDNRNEALLALENSTVLKKRLEKLTDSKKKNIVLKSLGKLGQDLFAPKKSTTVTRNIDSLNTKHQQSKNYYFLNNEKKIKSTSDLKRKREDDPPSFTLSWRPAKSAEFPNPQTPVIKLNDDDKAEDNLYQDFENLIMDNVNLKMGPGLARSRLNKIEKDIGQYNSSSAIFWASGACFLINRKIFFKVKTIN